MEERLYDLIFIVRPATPEEEIKKVLTMIEHACAEKGGKIEKAENWGTRKLAYKVMKHREGIYLYQQVRTNHGELVHELERPAGRAGRVIKYQDRCGLTRIEAPEKAGAEARTARRARPRRSTAAAPAEQSASKQVIAGRDIPAGERWRRAAGNV